MKVQEKSKKGQELRAAKKLNGVYKQCVNIFSSSANRKHIIKNIEAKMKGIWKPPMLKGVGKFYSRLYTACYFLTPTPFVIITLDWLLDYELVARSVKIVLFFYTYMYSIEYCHFNLLTICLILFNLNSLGNISIIITFAYKKLN